jgi:hypothetical protein
MNAILQSDAIVFDAYGSLLNVHAAMARYPAHLGANWQALAAEWRIKQHTHSPRASMTPSLGKRGYEARAAQSVR